MRDRPTHFSWGPILASLYRDLHEYVYLNGRALEVGVTLLHVWAWEHIVVLQPRVIAVPMGSNDPFMWCYKGGVSFTHMGEHRIPY